MQLLIDVGNTCIKMADWDGVSLSARQSCRHAGADVVALLQESFTMTSSYHSALIASVAPAAVNHALHAWLRDNGIGTINFVQASALTMGVQNAYSQPASLGVDRWLAIIAGYHEFHTAICVADCGSALTVDLVDDRGCHLGGMIVPGRHLLLETLSSHFDGLPMPCGEANPPIWGGDTEACMVSGSLACLAGTILLALRDAERRIGFAPRLILTGGDAPRLAGYLNIPYELRPNLVLQGLGLFATEQKRED